MNNLPSSLTSLGCETAGFGAQSFFIDLARYCVDSCSNTGEIRLGKIIFTSLIRCGAKVSAYLCVFN